MKRRFRIFTALPIIARAGLLAFASSVVPCSGYVVDTSSLQTMRVSGRITA